MATGYRFGRPGCSLVVLVVYLIVCFIAPPISDCLFRNRVSFPARLSIYCPSGAVSPAGQAARGVAREFLTVCLMDGRVLI